MRAPFLRLPLLLASTAASLALMGCANTTPAAYAPAQFSPAQFQTWSDSDPLYHLYAGDTVEVIVHTAPELSTSVIVGPDGRVNLPLAGGVMVGNATPREAAEAIGARYQSFLRDPIIEVRPLTFGEQRILVGGEVNAPGPVTMPGSRIGTLEAVMLAGGFKPSARAREVVLLRRARDGGVMMRTVNLTQAREGTLDNVPLQRFDIVYVPRSTIGEVNVFVDQYVRGILPLDSAFAYAITNELFNNN
ncbi:polysaccharide biosynthesis/export family protein [Woodsholea maritima]|uniref:polysaccharide biosynthesis/export family protein n=1 Tax=Woodsholea maritima TaxID=240237 RepID=UPI00036B84A9|nr:polysaccharide biosynthesis/export family protein [Woodsholea maritima]